MVRLYAVGDALAAVFTVSTEETTLAVEAVTDAGLKLQVTPAGKGLAHKRLTAPENPPREVMATVEVAELPGAMLAGENAAAESWKSPPLPNKGMSCGLPVSLSLTEMFADRKPSTTGAKLTLTVQLAPGAKEAPQLFV
jgi:hypothetical protein